MRNPLPPPEQGADLQRDLERFESTASSLDAGAVLEFVEDIVSRARKRARTAEADGYFGPTAEWYYRLIEAVYRTGAAHTTDDTHEHLLERADFWDLAVQRKHLTAAAPPVRQSVTSKFERAPRWATRNSKLSERNSDFMQSRQSPRRPPKRRPGRAVDRNSFLTPPSERARDAER